MMPMTEKESSKRSFILFRKNYQNYYPSGDPIPFMFKYDLSTWFPSLNFSMMIPRQVHIFLCTTYRPKVTHGGGGGEGSDTKE
jgi:hypothetical protein